MSSTRIRRGLLGRTGKAGVLVGGAALTVGLLGGAAWAAPGQTLTLHAHGTDAAGLVEVDFSSGPQLPAGCWLPPTDAIVSTSGNAIMHQIGNKTGFWFTSTYTGDASVFPLVQPVQPDGNGNNLVDTSAAPIATGHLTTWFGDESNQVNPTTGIDKVDVTHATASFHGTLTDGTPVNLNGHFQFQMKNGVPTVTNASVSC